MCHAALASSWSRDFPGDGVLLAGGALLRHSQTATHSSHNTTEKEHRSIFGDGGEPSKDKLHGSNMQQKRVKDPVLKDRTINEGIQMLAEARVPGIHFFNAEWHSRTPVLDPHYGNCRTPHPPLQSSSHLSLGRLAGKRPESCREDAATTGGPRQDDRRTRSPQLCAGPASNSPNSPRSQLYLNSNSAKFHPPGNFLELASLGKGVVHRPSWGSFLTARLWACSAGCVCVELTNAPFHWLENTKIKIGHKQQHTFHF
ncbi:hypothetical protein H671_5g14558 [Cricetulus griseus]|nr:hypothetical protein H671_5g14558 [Cricetulus griseus]